MALIMGLRLLSFSSAPSAALESDLTLMTACRHCQCSAQARRHTRRASASHTAWPRQSPIVWPILSQSASSHAPA
eukprot:11023465-Heterocapsa_arctica.AAC.1